VTGSRYRHSGVLQITHWPKKAAEGDMKAFEQLYERHNRRVYSLCLRMTGKCVGSRRFWRKKVFIQLFSAKSVSFRGESAVYNLVAPSLTVNQVLMPLSQNAGCAMEQTTDDGETPDPDRQRHGENPNGHADCRPEFALDKAILAVATGFIANVFTPP